MRQSPSDDLLITMTADDIAVAGLALLAVVVGSVLAYRALVALLRDLG